MAFLSVGPFNLRLPRSDWTDLQVKTTVATFPSGSGNDESSFF
jgi:hypothetical protein